MLFISMVPMLSIVPITPIKLKILLWIFFQNFEIFFICTFFCYVPYVYYVYDYIPYVCYVYDYVPYVFNCIGYVVYVPHKFFMTKISLV